MIESIISQPSRIAALLATAVALTACGSVPKPESEVSSARTSIEGARQAGASEFAAVPLQRAREELDRAEQAMRDEEYLEARQSAERASADAELAQAQAEKAKAQKAAMEVQQSLDTLRQESRRKIN